jgi:hypothetical protein
VKKVLRVTIGALLFAACSRPGGEPPPPEDKLTIASAAPGAVGALAAGTDAAPAPPTRARRTWAVPGDEEEEVTEPEELDGGVPDAALLPSPPAQDLPL